MSDPLPPFPESAYPPGAVPIPVEYESDYQPVAQRIVSGWTFGRWIALCDCGWRGSGRWRWGTADADLAFHTEQAHQP